MVIIVYIRILLVNTNITCFTTLIGMKHKQCHWIWGVSYLRSKKAVVLSLFYGDLNSISQLGVIQPLDIRYSKGTAGEVTLVGIHSCILGDNKQELLGEGSTQEDSKMGSSHVWRQIGKY